MSAFHRALCWSLLAHALLLGWAARLPVHNDEARGAASATVVSARLRPVSRMADDVPPSAVDRPSPAAPPVLTTAAPTAVAVPVTEARRSADPEPVVSEATVKPRDGLQGPASPSTPKGEGSSPKAVAVDPVPADGLRQYRLNLAREARRYRRFPQIARASGWEGQVVVVVSTVAGSSLPVATIAQGSGRAALDEAALEMMSQAIRSATIPDSLQRREFAFTLPVQFSLED